MLYLFDKDSLQYKRVSFFRQFKLFVLPILVAIPLLSISIVDAHDSEDIIYVQLHETTFNKENLWNKLNQLNLKFPHIAMAQAMLESNNFSSDIFKENHNLFGMKEARVRVNVAVGTHRNHAKYKSWEDSVMDYAFWVATYGSKCKTEQQFYNLLSKYAEDEDYESKLKKIVIKNKLK